MLSVRIKFKGCDLFCKTNSSAVVLKGFCWPQISPVTDVIQGGQQIHVQLLPYSLTILLLNLGSEDLPQAPASLTGSQAANYSGQLLPLTFAPVPPPPPPPQLRQSPPAASRTEPTQASQPASSKSCKAAFPAFLPPNCISESRALLQATASTVPQLPALQRLQDAVASVFIG